MNISERLNTTIYGRAAVAMKTGDHKTALIAFQVLDMKAELMWCGTRAFMAGDYETSCKAFKAAGETVKIILCITKLRTSGNDKEADDMLAIFIAA